MRFKPEYLAGLASLATGVGAAAMGSVFAEGAGPVLLASPVLAAAAPHLKESGKKLVEMVSEHAVSKGWGAVHAQLKGVQVGEELPANHDLLRAVRKAWLLGLTHCLSRCRADVTDHPDEFTADAVLDQLDVCMHWIKRELRASTKSDYFDLLLKIQPGADAVVGLTDVLDDLGGRIALAKGSEQASILCQGLFDMATQAVLDELSHVLQAPVLGPLRDWIYGYNAGHGTGEEYYSPGWSLAAAAWFAQLLKQDTVLQTVVFGTQLQSMLRGQTEMVQRLNHLGSAVGDVLAKLDQFEDRWARLELSYRTTASYADGLVALFGISQGGKPQALLDWLGGSLPAGSKWSQTATQVRRRIAELQESFAGRERDIQHLDHFLQSNSRGLVILTAPPGHGKSALLSEWVEHRALSGDRILRHFISTRYDKTVEPAQILGHLLMQWKDPSASRGELLESSQALGQSLHEATQRAYQSGSRVILIIDGLDEATSVLPAFVEDDLAEGVFVVVSCRATPGAWPKPLLPWKNRMVCVPSYRHELGPLSLNDALQWLLMTQPSMPSANRHSLAARLLEVSNGIPLFLSYLLKEIPTGRHAPDFEGEGFVTSASSWSLPASFIDYVREQFSQLAAEGETVWSYAHQRLLATLCQTRGPMSYEDLSWLLDGRPHLDSLDHRLTRWLSIQNDGHERQFALAHPLLSEALLACISPRLVREVERDLTAWMQRVWMPQAELPGSTYAVDWLPAHLAVQDESSAANLLRNAAFLRERLRDPGRALQRLERTLDEWAGLPLSARQDDAGRAWTAFWAENETRLLSAISANTSRTRTPQAVVMDSMGDGALCWTNGMPIPRLARTAHAAPDTELLRSIENAHSDIGGVIQVDKRLLSWSVTGALRFWSIEGKQLPGGCEGQDKLWISHIVPLGDRFVGWGGHGNILFWSANGESIPGGHEFAHRSAVMGIGRADDKLVSWGNDGALRLWTLAGEALPGGVPDAHSDGVIGVLALGNQLVSWGGDGIIRFWSLTDSLRHEWGVVAHASRIRGVIDTSLCLVSWGEDGAIRCWSYLGELLPGGDDHAHDRVVNGVLQVQDHLVSWGWDSAIRYWSLSGEACRGGVIDAHPMWVDGVYHAGDRLVSWSVDGSICVWSIDGERLPGGCSAGGSWNASMTGDWLVSWSDFGTVRYMPLRADLSPEVRSLKRYSSFAGAMVADDHLISWSADGALHFWPLSSLLRRVPRDDGENEVDHVSDVRDLGDHLVSFGGESAMQVWTDDGRRAGPAPPPIRASSIWGIKEVDGRLVTWEIGGGVRFWTRIGAPLVGGADAAHQGMVLGVEQIGDALASWSLDGTLRLWSVDGFALPGGFSHGASMAGLLVLPDRLVSFGSSAIRFWSYDGAPEDGGDAAAHGEGKLEMLDLGGNLVSWGEDGAIRFWSSNGKALAGGSPNAHDGRVNGLIKVGDTLLSWGDDGAIRRWSFSGQSLLIGTIQAHTGSVMGVMCLGAHVVSWGADGALRFWSPSGEPMEGGGARAHQGRIVLVKPVGRRLVSVGEDKVMQIWSRDGKTRHARIEHACSSKARYMGIVASGDQIFSWDATGVINTWNMSGDFLGSVVPPGGASRVIALERTSHLVVVGRAVWFYPLNNGIPWSEGGPSTSQSFPAID